MGYRYQVPGFARACMVLALSVLVYSVAPSQIGLAQSAPPPLTPWRGLVDHASVNVSGQASQASVDLTAKSLSADGRFVLMTSYASDLVSDQSSYLGVFLRDRANGTTRRVSVSNDRTTPQDGHSAAGSLSANGRQIAFMSSATNLVQGDTNGVWDIFVHDLDAERTVRVSVATAGTQADADSYSPVISATGRFVAFASRASSLAPGGVLNQPAQVFVHDRDVNGNGIFDEPGSRATSVISVSPGGGRANDWTRNIRISGDGRVVLFESRATNLLPGTLGGTNHVYVHDRQLHQTTLVDRGVTGGPASWGAEADSSDLSDDGRYVTFSSISPDFAPDLNWAAQVFRHDRADPTPNATVIVSRRPDGVIADDSTYSTAISGDGRYVVLRTVATNLASPSPVDGRGSVIVRDMADGTLTRVDVTGDGSALNHWYPYNVAIAADGTAVAFNSDATNAVYSPNPGAQHAFVATAFAAAPASASYPRAGGTGSIDVSTLPPTGWNAVSLDPWITLSTGAGFDAGPRVVSYIVEANPAQIVRDGRIQLGSILVTIHQDADDPTPPVVPALTWTPADITYGAPLGSGQLSAAADIAGTFAYSPAAGTVLSAGSHTLAVTFTPHDAAKYASSTESRLVTVAPAPLTITARNASKPFGQPLPAFTSTLSAFVNGDTMASLGGALGHATPATASSAVGSYAIVPSGVSSPNYSITFVNGTLSVVKAATVVTAAASPNPVGFDQPVTFTANVGLAAPGLGTPTGYVQFFTGGTLIGSVPLSGGPVSLTTAGLPAGTHTMTATYSGDGNLTGSSSTATVTFRTAATSSNVTLSSSEDPSRVGEAVRFTAAVSGPAGTVSGSVGFYDGATLIGTAPVVGSTASFTTSSLAAGAHAITARFSGSPSMPPSVSAAFAHTVQPSNPMPKKTTTTVAASPSPAALGSEVALTATVWGSPNKVPLGTVVFFANGTVIGTAALSATDRATATATLRLSTLPHGGHSISAAYLADATHRASSGAVRVTVN